MRLFANQNYHGRCPGHLHAQQALERILFDQTLIQPLLIGGLGANGTVPDLEALSGQQFGQFADMIIVRVMVTNKNVPAVWH